MIEYNRSKRVDISKFNRRFVTPPLEADAERPAGEFSPGKAALDLRDGDVANYVHNIGESWRRGVQAMMEVARLCAEACERLTSRCSRMRN